MSISRRGFFKSAVMSAVVVGLFSHSARFVFAQEKSGVKDAHGYFQVPPQALGERLFHFKRATFEPYLQSEFRVAVGPYRVVTLTLVKVEDRTPRPQRGRARLEGECFSLLFKASGQLSELQQTYVLEHEALGNFTLFLVDASEKDAGTFYQAIINHTRPVDNPSMKTQ